MAGSRPLLMPSIVKADCGVRGFYYSPVTPKTQGQKQACSRTMQTKHD